MVGLCGDVGNLGTLRLSKNTNKIMLLCLDQQLIWTLHL